MSFKSLLIACLLIINIPFSFSQEVDKNPPPFNYIEATLFTSSVEEGRKLMMMRGHFPLSSGDIHDPYTMKMWFLEAEEGDQVEPIFFDYKGYIYIKTDEGYIKTYFDTVLFPLIPFLSQADEFKSDIDVELGIDPLPKSWPLLSLVTSYNIGHFEGNDHIAKKEKYTKKGEVYTRFTSVDPDNLGYYIDFDKYGRLYSIVTPEGAIRYDYFFSKEYLMKDFPLYAKHEPNMGEMMTGLLIALFGGFGG